MRIKKSKLQEIALDTAKDRVEKTKDLIRQTSSDFEQMGVDNAGEAAADVVSSALSGDGEELNEVVNGEYVVQFHSERNGEDPFIINGIKWQYVNGIYPNGKKDIAVYRFDHDLAYDFSWFHKEVIGNLNEVNKEVMDDMIKTYGSKEAAEKVYYATANKQDRDPESFEMNEIDPGTGEDFGDIGYRDIEAGADDYEEYQKIMQSIGDDEGIQYTDDTEGNGLPFESTKLAESTNKRKVLRTLKVKDLRNE